MPFAPKDEHEAQVQFDLERGIPATSAVMSSQRLPFPSKVFDLINCARCRVPWHADGGMLLLELNRVLHPGGYFVDKLKGVAASIYRKPTSNECYDNYNVCIEDVFIAGVQMIVGQPDKVYPMQGSQDVRRNVTEGWDHKMLGQKMEK
ncbi:hypothetical protein IEQ34_019675 [Dendrobium chrysotoxum]|uniref:Methyltransferase n=1 Tax=Dendrobium chrysotoxum TaxID=161865 RepID=A0AAV7G816_DENCH|nr:hypothetical protein IEQ34_019675 [Dendrobium chrysotoxum]